MCGTNKNDPSDRFQSWGVFLCFLAFIPRAFSGGLSGMPLQVGGEKIETSVGSQATKIYREILHNSGRNVTLSQQTLPKEGCLRFFLALSLILPVQKITMSLWLVDSLLKVWEWGVLPGVETRLCLFRSSLQTALPSTSRRSCQGSWKRVNALGRLRLSLLENSTGYQNSRRLSGMSRPL
jgi:hypothetical protein